MRVTVNSKHLLSAGKVTTEDKTADIVGTLASIAAQAVALEVKARQKIANLFYSLFDPFNDGDVCFVTEQLRLRNIRLTVGPRPRGEVLPSPEVKGIAPVFTERGLVFRPAVICNITITYPREPGDRNMVAIKDTEQFILPNRTKLCVMEYNRMPFVKKVREIGFTDGMLTNLSGSAQSDRRVSRHSKSYS